MVVTVVNNPRKENGDFGDVCCDMCGSYTGAYVRLLSVTIRTICKGCLIKWISLIDNCVLNDAIEKGKGRNG